MKATVINELWERVDLSKQLEIEKKLHLSTQNQLSEMTEYADKLAQGLPCLPKDVEVLREANAGLAQETHELAQSMFRSIVGLTKAYSKATSMSPDKVCEYLKRELLYNNI